MSDCEMEAPAACREAKVAKRSGPSCVVTHREIRPGDSCVMLLTVPPLPMDHPLGDRSDGACRRRYAAPPIFGESDGDGWLDRAVRDEALDFMLFAIGGTDWSTASEVQRNSGLRVADGGFTSWHSVAVPIDTVFVSRRAWYELLDSAMHVFPLQMNGVVAQAQEALRILCRSSSAERLTRKKTKTISIADPSVVAQVLRDTACLDLHPNTKTALWWYTQLGRQAGCLNETNMEQLISRFVQQAIFQRALGWLT